MTADGAPTGVDRGQPRVTVGIPVYNDERFLPETLEKVQAQDYVNLEIVISDNGSTDSTEQICRSAAEQDRRIVYSRTPQNKGMGWNFNRALELATSPLFMWNCSDDLAHPAYVSSCVDKLTENESLCLAYSRVDVIDEHGVRLRQLGEAARSLEVVDASQRVHNFLRDEAWDAVFGVARTELLRAVGGMPPLTGDDVILGVRLLVRAPMARIEEPLFQRRHHANQSSEQQSIFDGLLVQRPDAQPRLAFPHWRIAGELVLAAVRAPLSLIDRYRCLSSVVRGWIAPKSRRLVGDLRRNLREQVRLVRGRRS